MDKLSCMRAFVSVVEAGGFSSAARQSTLTKALLSKYVAQLESDLGVRLLQRTTRQVSTTEIGETYYERCVLLIEELNKANFKDLNLKTKLKMSENLTKYFGPNDDFGLFYER